MFRHPAATFRTECKQLRTYTWNWSLSYNFNITIFKCYTYKFLYILELQHFKHFKTVCVIPTLTCWAYIALFSNSLRIVSYAVSMLTVEAGGCYEIL